ncbi:hypothetical protein [Streptomyces griseus]|uniref:hypothetical protein n=1 Tax=Streptomyces griseus TaxID=1911 RepID=UPI0036C7FA18
MTGPAAPVMTRTGSLPVMACLARPPVMTRTARPAVTGPALPPHPHHFRTEESQP